MRPGAHQCTETTGNSTQPLSAIQEAPQTLAHLEVVTYMPL